jgi:hypothetical protein
VKIAQRFIAGYAAQDVPESAKRTIENSPAIHRWVCVEEMIKAREAGDRPLQNRER